MDDESLMPFDKYKGDRLIDIPAWYLLSLLNNDNLQYDLKEYILDNENVLIQQKRDEDSKKFKNYY